jgi:hypothetical protein
LDKQISSVLLLLAAVMDISGRAGGMGIKSAASSQWGDAQNAMDYWAQKIPARHFATAG